MQLVMCLTHFNPQQASYTDRTMILSNIFHMVLVTQAQWWWVGNWHITENGRAGHMESPA